MTIRKKRDSAKWVLKNAALWGSPFFHKRALIAAYQGELYWGEQNYDTALYYFKYSLANVQKTEWGEGHMACVYAYAGDIYHKKNQPELAAVYLYKGLQLLQRTKKVQHFRYTYNVYNFLATFLFDTKQYSLAQNYFTQSEAIALRHNHTRSIVNARLAKAALYAEMKQLDSSIYLFETILKEPGAAVADKLNSYHNLGSIYALPQFKNEPAKAVPYFEQGLKLFEKNNDKEWIDRTGINRSKFLVNFAAAYLNLARQRRAPLFYDKALRLYEAIDSLKGPDRLSPDELKNLYSNRGLLLFDLGRYKEAAELSIHAIAISDSMSRENTLSDINQSELQYRTAAKDKLIAQNKLQLAEQENKIQRQYLWIGGMASSAIIIVLLFVVVMRRKQHQTELARLKDVMAGEERERVRIARDLHDGIVSQLSAIKINFSNLPVLHPDMNDATDDFHQALLQLEQSITELRNTSHNLLPEILQREGLVAAINIYCREISRMTPCAVAFQVLGGLPGLKKEFQLGVYRIIQELLQNIVKHAGATDALLQFNVEQSMFDITVDDNGCGLQASPLPGMPGVGLSNIQQRVTALGGRMEIETGEGRGTSVYLSFDLKDYIEKT